ncbi:EAL and HDOD domain-containing protein [Pseudoduganella namucuonensis]|uniref:EAL and modified HD-GYP domain-containing signal transduction protein n=1 Tax=Pseudoduganella namucuonensis TaxID=1035707 RepID=A0A1I7LF68_9BURK|nr:HDOD domain-containing protein [Pseudoduganella namucuonensis]SFV08330.1 EAL and modified HD-GYP domain-containing signal transduction protein [Pseudoduganella namucuonensis]
MHQTNFLVREPLLDPRQRVVGYELCWQRLGAAAPTLAELEDLVGFVAANVQNEEGGWLLRSKTLFLEAVPGMLSTDALHNMPPEHTVLSIKASMLANPDTLAAVQALRVGGVGILLREADLARVGSRLGTICSYVEVKFTGADVASQARAYAALKASTLRMIGRPVSTWNDFDACAALGLDAFVGKLHLTPRPGADNKGMNTAQAIIMQLMQMVNANAEIKQIEDVLKRDAAVSYQLLRYINSAGFGTGREITSLRQAISMLGYAPLYRWLTLLLATASSSGYSPVLLETAVVRGRLAELLGAKALGKADAENIFVAGMFSLLDRLLGIPMEEVLSSIQLSDDVVAALLTRSGKYGPYLALAEACELNSALVSSLAAAVNLSPAEVNQAHLAALAWTQTIAG